MSKPLVICDHDFAIDFTLNRSMRFDAEFLGLADSLPRNRQWRQDDNRLVRVLHDILRPDQKLKCLSQAAILEQRSAAFAHRVFDHSRLEVHEPVGHENRIKAAFGALMDLFV